MKPTHHHIPFLDYLRGVAILSVFVYHGLCASYPENAFGWNGWFRTGALPTSFYAVYPAAFGFIGVPIFFAISGFCIHLSHRHFHGETIRTFLQRRFFRIYPPYLAALCFFAFVFHATRLGTDFTGTMKDFSSHLFLIHNFSNSYYFGNINSAYWSIALEAQLYLLYPVLLWLRKNIGWKDTLLLVGLIEFGFRGAEAAAVINSPGAQVSHLMAYSPFTFWFSWSIGAALASAYMLGEPLPFRQRWCWIFPLALVTSYFIRPLEVFTFPLASLSTVALMAWGLGRSNPRIGFLAKGNVVLQHLRWTGLVSYSAYLIHQPLVNLVPGVMRAVYAPRVAPHLMVFGACLLSWIPIFILAYFSYQWIELPSIAWGKQVLRRKRERETPLTLAPEAAGGPILIRSFRLPMPAHQR